MHEKNALIQWIDTMTVWEWSSQIEQLEFMIKQLMKAKSDQNPLKHNWYLSFLCQHLEFKTQYSCNLNQDQKDAENIKFIQKWFDLYNFTWIQHGILKLNIYNMNEKRFTISITNSFKVLIQCTERQAFSV